MSKPSRRFLLILICWTVPVAQAFELRMPPQDWVVLQSRRVKTMGEFIVGVTLPEAKQEEILAAAKRRKLLDAPVPSLQSKGNVFEILGDSDRVTIDLTKATAGEFLVNGRSVLLNPEMSVEKMLNRIEGALKSKQARLSLLPRAEARSLKMEVAAVVMATLAGSLYYVSRKMSFGSDSDAVDITYAIQTGNNKAVVRDFKCDEQGRLVRWEVSRNIGGKWSDDRVEMSYEGHQGLMRHITEDFDCLMEWDKKGRLSAKGAVDIPIAVGEACNQHHKASGSYENVSVFANYVSFSKIAACCKKQSCQQALTLATSANLSDRARADAGSAQ